MAKTSPNEYKLKKLRAQLYGHYTKIANREGVNTTTITRLLDGEFSNLDLLQKCIDYRDELEAKINQVTDRI